MKDGFIFIQLCLKSGVYIHAEAGAGPHGDQYPLARKRGWTSKTRQNFL